MFLDAVVSDRKGAAHELTMKLLVKDNASLDDAVRAALSTYGRIKAKENPGNDTSVDVYMTRIKYVMCKSTDLGNFVTEPEARIDALDSVLCPILKSGFHVRLNQMEVEQPVGKKAKPCAHAKMMGWTPPEVMYLMAPLHPEDEEGRMDHQIGDKLISLFELNQLGYCNGDQKTQLQQNKGHLQNILCFIQKNWQKLFRANFPQLPDGNYLSMKMLNMVGTTCRM